jgi:heavy metal sensor kinase
VRSRLSLGTRWTLRYTLALLVTVTIFGIFTYEQILARTQEDARFVLELQVHEVVETLQGQVPEPPDALEAGQVAASVERSVAAADRDLKLGLQLFDQTGEPLLVRGSGEHHAFPLPAPESLDPALESWRLEDVVGEKYPYLVLTVPVQGGFVQGSLYTRIFVRNARDVRDIYLYSLPAVLLVTALLGTWLARGILRPLQEMNTTARRITGTHLEATIPTTGSGDELDELAVTLNGMIARIRRSVERTRRFSANAAHELRTPLNALRSRLEVTLEQDRSPEEYRRILAETADEVEELSTSVHGMMRLAQSEAGLSEDQRVPVALEPLLAEVVEFFEPLAAEAEVSLEARLEGAGSVPGDPAWLHQLFANLVHNAVKYTRKGGHVRVACASEPGGAVVRVADDGIGVPLEEQARIFEPFHRVRGPGHAPGAGLGLALAREIARAHGGRIELESRPGAGSTFSVHLPCQEAPPPA